MRRPNRTGAKLLALLTVAAAGVAASALPAQGHGLPCSTHPSDPSVACVPHPHGTIDVCDRDADGHEVWARQYYASPDHVISTPPDPNGSQSGCGHFQRDSASFAYQVCIQFEGCGSLIRY
jgi:hypothetical protein